MPLVRVAQVPNSRRFAPVALVICLAIALLGVALAPVLFGGESVAARTTTRGDVAARETVAYASLEEATVALGFAPTLPGALPAGSSIRGVNVLDGYILEIEYITDAGPLVYRTAQGNEDLSNGIDKYAYSANEQIGDITRTYFGSGESKLNVALWAADGFTFALLAPEGMSGGVLKAVAESVA